MNSQIKSTYNQHIGIYEGYIPSDYCDLIIQTFNDNELKSKNRQEWGGYPGDKAQDKSISFTNEFDDSYSKPLRETLLNTIIPHYAQKYPHFKEQVDNYGISIPFVKVQKTLPGEGYHVWHDEFSYIEEEFTRGIVYTLYLNDIEEGGETEFLYQHLRVKPKKGMICLFPPYYTHVHRGNPPLSGEKYIMTGWGHFNILNN